MTSPQFMQHTFGGNRLDRAEAKRRNEDWVTNAYADQDALVLPFWRQRVLLNNEEAPLQPNLA